MSRPLKDKVDYFPHYTNHGMTIFILEEKYGNNGYAFWFKLLEMLANSDNHYLDLRKPQRRVFLTAKTHLDWDLCKQILDLLAEMETIDKELWSKKMIVWSDNFIKNLTPVYAKRKKDPPKRPFSDTETPLKGISGDGNPNKQPKKDTKIPQESKGSKGTKGTKESKKDVVLSFDRFWDIYPKKVGKRVCLEKWKKLKKNGELPELSKIIQAVKRQIQSEQWQKGFIPNPLTWLNQGRWEDEEISIEEIYKKAEKEKEMKEKLKKIQNDYNYKFAIESGIIQGWKRKLSKEKVKEQVRDKWKYDKSRFDIDFNILWNFLETNKEVILYGDLS